MNIVGIIAEYNPFHNGHAYQIEKIKKDFCADYVVVAMSGDFVQRGAPALLDKYARTQMALSCGADLIIELPVLWSTSSAESFAMAGVTLFDKMGCVNAISFGAETDRTDLLSQIALTLTDEPALYQQQLTTQLKSGKSFPAARSSALYTSFSSLGFSDHELSAITEIVASPNNILAIEYLKAIQKRHSSLKPLPIVRKGAGYHDTSMNTTLASASAIRNFVSTQSNEFDFEQIESAMLGAMPADACKILSNYLASYSALYSDDFSTILRYLLLLHQDTGYAQLGDTGTFLSNRIQNIQQQFQGFDSFCEQLKSKELTYTRISRVLTHLLLSISETDYLDAKKLDYIPYLRVLGFCKEATPLFSELKKNASIPLITKLGQAKDLLSPSALALLQKDIFAASLYENMLAQKCGTIARSEYSREIIRV